MHLQEIIELDAPADDVWRTVGNFAEPGRWIVGLDGCSSTGSGVGATRRLVFGNIEVHEQLEGLDEMHRSLSYRVIAGGLPVSDYRATLTVAEISIQRALVTWCSSCTPKDISEGKLRQLLKTSYRRNLEMLAKVLDCGTADQRAK